MICLPDVNVLIALHDPAHLGHEKAHSWFQATGRHGWATCPLNGNGFVRLLSQPQYPNNVGSVATALHILHNRVETYADSHLFWHDTKPARRLDFSRFLHCRTKTDHRCVPTWSLPSKRRDANYARHRHNFDTNHRLQSKNPTFVVVSLPPPFRNRLPRLSD